MYVRGLSRSRNPGEARWLPRAFEADALDAPSWRCQATQVSSHHTVEKVTPSLVTGWFLNFVRCVFSSNDAAWSNATEDPKEFERSITLVMDKDGGLAVFAYDRDDPSKIDTDGLEDLTISEAFQGSDSLPSLDELFTSIDPDASSLRYSSLWHTRKGDVRAMDWTTRLIRNRTGCVAHVVAQGVDVTDLL